MEDDFRILNPDQLSDIVTQHVFHPGSFIVTSIHSLDQCAYTTTSDVGPSLLTTLLLSSLSDSQQKMLREHLQDLHHLLVSNISNVIATAAES